MPVFGDHLWWVLNWPWMLLWLVTAASGLYLLGMALDARRRRRGLSNRLIKDRTCVYLDDRQVMDTFRMRGHAVALRKEVEQRTKSSRAIKLAWRLFPFVDPEANIDASHEVVTKYVEDHQPISVIAVILDGLERDDALVHADLRHSTVRHNAALRNARAATGSRRGPVRLSTTSDLFVLLTGDFTLDTAASTPDRTAFTAPLGPGGRIRMACLPAGFRIKDPDDLDLSPAVCLGKVRAWRADSEVLDVRPMAVFR